jgi:hypothetical protein
VPAEAVTAARGLTVLVDPRLDKSAEPFAWSLFADPAVTPVFEASELSGYEGPRVESRTGFDVMGMEWRVFWFLGADAVDSRVAWKNPGAAPTARAQAKNEVRR